jgi:hypothetical protein
MNNETFITTVVRMDAVLTRLEATVSKLEAKVDTLQTKQHYWSGAITAVGVVASAIGATAALVFQWLRH